jgi:hypothetical protein
MRVRWFLFAPAAVVLVALAQSPAQPPREPKDGKLVIPIEVSAARPPSPALKYTLLPELRDCRPGNQVPAFYKCFMEQNYLFFDKEANQKRDRWMAAPLADLKSEKELVGYGGSAATQADYAARLETVDWQLLDKLKTDGLMLLLPDVQQMRALSAVLKVKVRGEIARGEFDAAIRTLQTMFALAHTFDGHPTLIGNLVGIAITGIALDAVEELIQQPGTPNLFWALADLPVPFIDLRKGMQGERAWLGRDFDALHHVRPLSEAEVKRLIAQAEPLAEAVFDFPSKEDKPRPKETAAGYYGKLAADPKEVKAAKERLAKSGHAAADLDKLSPLQLVLMDDFTSYEVFRDDLMKWTNVPYWKIPTDVNWGKPPRGIFTELVPAGFKVLQAQARTQQRIALLQAVEAVRAFAAEHDGKVPGTLDEPKLPLPPDPVTGKLFVYEVNGGTAVIRGTPPKDRKTDWSFNRVYEITIRK